MMIISGFAVRIGKTLSDSVKLLISCGGIEYLEEFYSTLHLLSNDDVIDELVDMAKMENAK